ncbi:MAG: hypothetical protein OXP71_11470 [Candidatus Poribacteria bacterium]|nr:hypothetical protein [Candidatus Poribacteria bacterium]
MSNAWNLIHNRWEHVGGSIAISWGENIKRDYPPKSYFIDWESPCTGELCGSVFWIKLNYEIQDERVTCYPVIANEEPKSKE